MIYLDTHVVVILHAGWIDKIPQKSQKLIELSKSILISPMVYLEMQYLYEIERIKISPKKILDHLTESIGLKLCELPFPIIAAKALHETWTRDPFDRIITAQARIDQASLLTKDRLIHKHYSHAIWT